ncbi:MAG: hypothetical protein AAGB23_08295 [Pseudomonadota bacterium]
MPLLSTIARFAPFNAIRVSALRAKRDYQIGRGVRIGFGCRFEVDSLDLGDGVIIGRFNRFAGPIRIAIGARSQIGSGNHVIGGQWVKASRFAEEGYQRTMRLGSDCLITDNHLFDCVGLIEIGDGSWVAGSASQLWTHGVGVAERDVIVGEQCYLGSAVRLAPGARLGDQCILSLASVLTRDLSSARCALVAGSPAQIVKQLEADYEAGRIEQHKRNW